MGKLTNTNTKIQKAIQRAFPQTNFPETAIKLLEKFEDGEWIKRDQVTDYEFNVLIDLATAGIIESNRKPKFMIGQFAGFENSFRYKADLEYLEVETKKSNGSKLRHIIYWILVVGFGCAAGFFLTVFLAK